MDKKLLAFCLGDGCITNRHVLQLRHCSQQKEYLEWKHSELSKIIKCSEIKDGNQNGYPYSAFYTSEAKDQKVKLEEIYNKLYQYKGYKYFSKEIVDNMDAYCVAILYMDDGSLTAKKRNGVVTCYDLVISVYGEQEECQNLIDKLATLGMKFTLRKNKGKYSIRCGTRAARKFIDYIKPLIPEFECFKETKFKPLVVNSAFIRTLF